MRISQSNMELFSLLVFCVLETIVVYKVVEQAVTYQGGC